MIRILALVAVALSSSCNSDELGLFASAQWRVRCPDPGTGCSRDGDIVDVFKPDGEDGVRIACNLTTDVSGTTLSFRINDGHGNQLAVDRLATSPNGGTVIGNSCQVTVDSDEVSYYGTCGSSAPTATQQCQISNFRIVREPQSDELMSGSYGPEVQFQLACQGISNPANAMFVRDLRRDATNPPKPALIRLINCPGV